MKKRYLILIAIISYLFFTLSNVPAARVIALIKQQTGAPVDIHGARGSLWSGSADTLLVNNVPPIDNLTWDINTLYFLIAQLNADITAQISQQNILGNLKISPLGTVSVHNLRSQISGEVMQSLLQMPMGEIAGDFIFNIKEVTHLDTPLPLANGQIKWKSARLTLTETVDLGHITLLLEPEADTLRATIENKGGALSIQGTASLNPQHNYELDLTLTPVGQVSSSLQQGLGMIARRQSNGSYSIKRNGNLKQLGF